MTQDERLYGNKIFTIEDDKFDEGIILLKYQNKSNGNETIVLRCMKSNMQQLKTALDTWFES